MRALILLAFMLIGLLIIAVLRPGIFKAHPSLVPQAGAIPNSYFGITVHNYRSAISWSLSPFSSFRTWDTDVNWANINPARHTFIWSNLDELINITQRRGADLLFTLGRTPSWASAKPNAKSPYGPGQCAPPANMQDWE